MSFHSRYVKFLQYLDVLSGDDFEYLHPKGIIPASAIIKVGEQVRSANKTAKSSSDERVKGEGEMKAESDDEDDLLQGNQAELDG